MTTTSDERTRRPRTAGFSLVELLVAITLMMVAVTAFAAGSAAMARRSSDSSGLVQRSASLSEYVAELYATPWAALPSTACVDVDGVYPYERCVIVTDLDSRRKEITVVVTPEDPRMRADTMIIQRGLTAGSSPFGT